VWHNRIRVVIIPLILAFTFLAIWVASGVAPAMSTSIVQEFSTTFWGYSLGVTGLTLSMTVNALVTGLIVFRILKVSWEVKTTLEDQILDVTDGSGTLQRVIFVLLESGMALFCIQLARLVVTFVPVDDAYQWFIVSLHEMLNGITPTIIWVQMSLGSSFHDENEVSMVETAGTLHFALASPNPSLERGSVTIVDEERRDDDIWIS